MISPQSRQKIIPFSQKTTESAQIQATGERILIERFHAGGSCGGSPTLPTTNNPLLPIVALAGFIGLMALVITLPAYFNSQAFQLNQQLKFQQQQTEQLKSKIQQTNDCLEGIK